MICMSQNHCDTIARNNASAMTASDYTIFEPVAIQPTIWHVAKNDGSDIAYRVEIEKDECFCNCPFFLDNAKFGNCKHIEYVGEFISTKRYEEDMEAREFEGVKSF